MMKLTKGLMLGAGLAAAVLLARRGMQMYHDRTLAMDRGDRKSESTRSPYREIVEDALKQNEGAETPVARAFEDALEEEYRLERQLARDVGLKM